MSTTAKARNSPYFDHDMFRTVPPGTGLNRAIYARPGRAEVGRGALGAVGAKLWPAGLLAETGGGPAHDNGKLEAPKTAARSRKPM